MKKPVAKIPWLNMAAQETDKPVRGAIGPALRDVSSYRRTTS
jgi:hypothetical protein